MNRKKMNFFIKIIFYKTRFQLSYENLEHDLVY
jgi:hypothetical protein